MKGASAGGTFEEEEPEEIETRLSPWLFLVLKCLDPTEPALRINLSDVPEVTFGRGTPRSFERRARDGKPACDLLLDDPRVSSRHATLTRQGDDLWLQDLGSTNGTRLRGQPVNKELVRDGDLFEMGGYFFLLRWLPAKYAARGTIEASFNPAAPLGMQTLSPELEHRFEAFQKAAASTAPIEIRGETGTGKELAAHAAHRYSGRTGPFVAINCGGVAPNLVESELFGHKKGAFSGAGEHRLGAVRSAHRGTLFLDEIGDLPLPAQAALLRVLQERKVRPVGEDKDVPVDVRVLSATHRDLSKLVAAGEFRADLKARLAGHTLNLPPLHERRMDLGLIIAASLHSIEAAGEAARGRAIHLTTQAARALLLHEFPNNVRDLKTALEQGLIQAPGSEIGREHLPESVMESAAPRPIVEDGAVPEALERARLVRALKEAGGVVAAMARKLGKHETQVRRDLTRMGIDAKAFRAR